MSKKCGCILNLLDQLEDQGRVMDMVIYGWAVTTTGSFWPNLATRRLKNTPLLSKCLYHLLNGSVRIIFELCVDFKEGCPVDREFRILFDFFFEKGNCMHINPLLIKIPLNLHNSLYLLGPQPLHPPHPLPQLLDAPTPHPLAILHNLNHRLLQSLNRAPQLLAHALLILSNFPLNTLCFGLELLQSSL